MGCSDAGGGEGNGSDGGSGSGATNAAILGGSRREGQSQNARALNAGQQSSGAVLLRTTT